MVILFVLILVFVASDANGQRQKKCGGKCLFRLCNPDDFTIELPQGSPVILRAPGNAAYPYICRKFSTTQVLSTVLTTGEARVQVSKRSMIPISRWAPSGLRKRFSSNFFKVGNIPLSLKLQKPVQGIIRTSRDATQDDVINDKCVILPILSYNFADLKLRNFFSANATADVDCVSFVAKTNDLIVDLTWNLARNLDIDVTGPRGETGTSINKERGVAITKLKCIGGQESVLFKDPLRGLYTIVVSNPGSLPKRGTRSILSAQNGTVSIRENDTTDCLRGDPGDFSWGMRRMMIMRRGPKKIRQKTRIEVTVTLNGRRILKKKIKLAQLKRRSPNSFMV